MCPSLSFHSLHHASKLIILPILSQQADSHRQDSHTSHHWPLDGLCSSIAFGYSALASLTSSGWIISFIAISTLATFGSACQSLRTIVGSACQTCHTSPFDPKIIIASRQAHVPHRQILACSSFLQPSPDDCRLDHGLNHLHLDEHRAALVCHWQRLLGGAAGGCRNRSVTLPAGNSLPT